MMPNTPLSPIVITEKHLALVAHDWDGYANEEERALRKLHDDIETLVRQLVSGELATFNPATHRAVSVEAIRRMVAAIGQWSPLPLMTLSENEAYRIAYHFAEDCGALPRLTPDHDTREEK
jgi:hypothetical protein